MMDILLPSVKLIIFLGLMSPFYIPKFKSKIFDANLKFNKLPFSKLFLIFIVAAVSITIQSLFFVRFPWGNELPPLYVLYFIFSSVIIAPLLEETFFRGYIAGVVIDFFKLNPKRVGFYLINVLQILFFVIVHRTAASIPALILDASILTGLYYHTKKNLTAPLIYHMIINSTVLITNFL